MCVGWLVWSTGVHTVVGVTLLFYSFALYGAHQYHCLVSEICETSSCGENRIV